MYQRVDKAEAKRLEYNLFACEIIGKRVRFKSTTDPCSIRFNYLGTVTAVDNSYDCKGRQT